MYNEDKELTLLENVITSFDSKLEIYKKVQNKFAQIDYRENRKLECSNCLKHKNYMTCPNYSTCPIIQNYNKTRYANTIINKFEDFTEICFYKKDFLVKTNQLVSSDIDR